MMSIAKITGNGWEYLTRHTAHGDADPGKDAAQAGTNPKDPAAYYTAEGNPPGRWTGRAAHLLGVENSEVTEDQMRNLFGLGAHPDADAMITEYLNQHVTADMTTTQRRQVQAEAIRHVTLGRGFPQYQPLESYDSRVSERLNLIEQETGRPPTRAEERSVKVQEARRQRAAVAGFDLTFSPVKSAALLWAVDDRPQVRAAIKQAHEQAVQQALDLIQDHAAYTRGGAGGIAQIETEGLIAASFEHWDSRAGDPDLHTHVAVSSRVKGTDGIWRSLDARGLYRITVAASECYNTAFEAALTSRLGVTFTARPDTVNGKEPVREITGIPVPAIEFFSSRRAAIETRYAQLLQDYRTEHGLDPDAGTCHKLAQQATLDTRRGKKPPVPLPEKRARWREELTNRFGPGALDQITSAVPAEARDRAPADLPDPAELAERIVASVSARRSTWTVWHVRAEVERVLRTECPAVSPDQHRALADQLTELALSPVYCVSVEAPALLDEPTELRREDGESVFTEHASARYTSRPVLDAEQRLLDATRTPTVNGLAGPSVAAAIDGFEGVSGRALDAGQRALVTAFPTDDRLLLAGIGPAGAGKTTAMRAYAHVLRQAGRRLIPLATSAAAADVLGKELSAKAENLHKFVHEWTVGPFAERLRAGESVPGNARQFMVRPGDVILVDEAGMAGTFLLDELVSVAAMRGATVRLLGDDRQLSAVESGGALRLIAAQPGTPELSVLHRFRDPAEADATLKMRNGDGTALDFYADHDRIVGGSREAMAQAAYEGWKADMRAGKITLMAAGDGHDVTRLSAQARADRVAEGQVEADGVTLRDGNLAGTGDWIVTRQNNRLLSVCGGSDWTKNGDSWQVEQRHDDGSLTVRHLAHGGRVTLPAAYVAAHVQLLYATTAHRAQGTTVDTAHPLITEGLSREILYVLATRAREATTFYVATHDLPFDEDAKVDRVRIDPDAWAAREILTNIIATEGAALSATETIEVAQEEAGSLSTLVPRYLHAAHQYAKAEGQETAPETLESPADAKARLGDIAATVLGPRDEKIARSETAWPALLAALHRAEYRGHDARDLLADVVDQRELRTARSISEVLAWRIGRRLIAAEEVGEEAREEEPRSVRNTGLPPWIAAPDAGPDPGLPAYLRDAEALITARVTELADRAARERPAWINLLGRPPADEGARAEWLRHVAIAAAYRDEYQVTTDDPHQVLGPYPEKGRAGHRAYWQAAESVLAARRAAGLDTAAGHRATDPAIAQVAADVYRSLPEAERTEIASAVADQAGVLWLGNRNEPDEEAVVQPAYAGYLTAELGARKHVTSPSPHRTERQSAIDEPLEAGFARRGRPHCDIPARQGRAATPSRVSYQQPQLVPPQETWQRQSGPVPGR